MAVTAAEASESSKPRAVRDNLRRKRKKVISKAKACTILHEGRANDKPLTDKARKFMGARCSGQPVRRAT